MVPKDTAAAAVPVALAGAKARTESSSLDMGAKGCKRGYERINLRNTHTQKATKSAGLGGRAAGVVEISVHIYAGEGASTRIHGRVEQHSYEHAPLTHLQSIRNGARRAVAGNCPLSERHSGDLEQTARHSTDDEQ
jgi:hypothetical protein